MSSRGVRSPRARTSRPRSASSATFAGRAWQGPAADSSAAVRSQASNFRDEIQTVAPACRNPSAIIRPMPRDPPVTSAVLPVRSNSVAVSMADGGGVPVKGVAR